MCLKLLEVGGLLYSQFSLRTALRPLGLGSEPHSKLDMKALFLAQRIERSRCSEASTRRPRLLLLLLGHRGGVQSTKPRHMDDTRSPYIPYIPRWVSHGTPLGRFLMVGVSTVGTVSVAKKVGVGNICQRAFRTRTIRTWDPLGCRAIGKPPQKGRDIATLSLN